jgi:uncharacterized membrane protein
MTAATVPAPWPPAEPLADGVGRWGRMIESDGAPCVEWLLRRNCSMAPRQVFGFYLSLCAVSLAIALGFTWHGATPVLAFAGAELVLVGVALLVYARHAADQERIALLRGRLHVTTRRGTQTEAIDFRAAWVRVEPTAGDGSLVELSGDGQRIHVGRYVRAEWRQQLAQELRAALRAHTFISDPK